MRLGLNLLFALFGSGFLFAKPVMVLVEGGKLPESSEMVGTVVETFLIGKFEVTWEEWQDLRDWAVGNGYRYLANVGKGAGKHHPVGDLNWYHAMQWCNAKSEKEGLVPFYELNGEIYRGSMTMPNLNLGANGYRLPTEAEWEWASRGGVRSQGFAYSGSNDLNEVAWFSKNSGGATHEVGKKAANELGIHDMSGNVEEKSWDAGDAKARRRGGDCFSCAVYCGVEKRRGFITLNAFRRSGGFRLARNAP